MRNLDVDGLPPVSKIGLGTWQFGSREWGYGDAYASDEAGAIVRRALELGIDLIDTAEVYGMGRSERIVGRALRPDDDVFLATKLMPVVPLPPIVEQRGTASVRRLGGRRIDLYQVHQPNPLAPDTVIMKGMRRLREAGLIEHVGVSNYSLQRWRRSEVALGDRVLSNQVCYSLVDRRPESQLIPWAEREGRLIIAYSPLGQGLLAAKYDADHLPADPVRRGNPLFLPENLERARSLLGALRDVAKAHDATPAQVALAYVIHHPNVVAIPGASRVEQVEQNAEAADLALTDDEVDGLREAAEAFHPVRGARAAGRIVTQRLFG